MLRFAGVDLNGAPDETTICKFRHFLEARGLTEALFEQTRRYLSDRGLIVKERAEADHIAWRALRKARRELAVTWGQVRPNPVETDRKGRSGTVRGRKHLHKHPKT